TLEQELTALRLYIEMEALRFKQNFNFKIINSNDIDEEDIKVPPLIIQPFVENAIKHGLMHREGEASLIISTRHFNDALEIKVIDNGIGRVASEKLKGDLPLHRSMGIQLTKERILLTDTSGDFIPEVTINDLYDIDDHPSGTEVTIKLPLL
ncbi:MAG: ATP-binding protein, partial [Saprospiraceae bacterium]